MSAKAKSKKSAVSSQQSEVAPVAPELTGDQAYEQLGDILRQLDDRIRQAQRRVDDLYQQHQQAEEFLAFETDKAKTLRAKIGAADELLVAMPFDADLRKALLAKKVYTNAIKNGATDKELIQLLSGEGRLNNYSSPFEIGRDEDQPVIYSYRNHRRVSPPILTGQDEILGTVRRVLAIPQPKPVEKKPAPTPAASKAVGPLAKKPAAVKAKNSAKTKAETAGPTTTVKSAASKPSAKPPKPAKPDAKITNVRLSRTPNGSYAVKYRKGTHSKSFLIGAPDPGTARIETAKALGIDPEQVSPDDDLVASLALHRHAHTPAPTDDQTPVDAPSNPDQTDDGAADVSSDAAPVKTNHVLFLSRNADYYVRSPDLPEPLKLEAQDADAAKLEAAEWLGISADQITVGGIEDVPAVSFDPNPAENK